MARGVLTDKLKKLYLELTGKEVTLSRLRLMPYLIYTLSGNTELNRIKLSVEESNNILDWISDGYNISTQPKLIVTEEFYNIICKILLVGYMEDVVI